MTLKEIYQFFQSQPAVYLNQELATCFVLHTLLKQDSYGTELIQIVEDQYPPYRLSDTVLYGALRFLLREGVITSYSRKVEGRGRPRLMYHLSQDMESQASELAQLWQDYVARNSLVFA
jgi:DNA-binding PadR family transcriptional regulator